jgi:HD-like signal output (HDOD) protein
LEIELMKIECNACHKSYHIKDEKLPTGKRISLPCPACKSIIEIDLRVGPVDHETLPSNKTVDDKVASESIPGNGDGDALKKKILKSLKDLPPMPQALIKARKIISDQNSGFQELAVVLETDPAIATKVLKMANSPYYGLSGKVSSIQHASVVLGYKALGDLVTMAGSSGLVAKPLDGYGLDAGDLWVHSMAVAIGSRMIAEKRVPELANDAFSAGLIHDSGKLILDKHVLERKEAFEGAMGNGTKTFLTAEKEILGFDHAEIASEACSKWNIPDELSVAIQYHHYPQQADKNALAYILHMADSIALMSGIGTGIDGMLYQMDEKAMEFLRLEPDDLGIIIENVVEQVENMETGMG